MLTGRANVDKICFIFFSHCLLLCCVSDILVFLHFFFSFSCFDYCVIWSAKCSSIFQRVGQFNHFNGTNGIDLLNPQQHWKRVQARAYNTRIKMRKTTDQKVGNLIKLLLHALHQTNDEKNNIFLGAIRLNDYCQCDVRQ